MPLPVPVPRCCPACASPAQELVREHPLAAIEGVSLHAGYRVVACAGCGLVYADGIPSQAAFDRYYQDSSRYENNARMGLPGPVDQARYAAIAAELAEQLGPRLPLAGLRVAEVGAATGGLLAELKRAGFRDLLGIDPSPQCVRAGRELFGLDMAPGTLFEPLPQAPFDLVIAVGVLEHVRDLDRALRNLAGAMRPGALLYLEVPDLEGFRRTNEAPFQEFSTEHITFFTRRSLANLLGRYGFQADFGSVPDRVHGGGSTMQVIAGGFRLDGAVRAPVADPAGPAAARAYVRLCQDQVRPELELMARLARSGQPLAVWGAGTVACRLMASSALPEARLAAFVDSNPHLQGRRLAGIPIQPPAWLGTFEGSVLVASRGYAREIQQLIRAELGFRHPVLTLDS